MFENIIIIERTNINEIPMPVLVSSMTLLLKSTSSQFCYKSLTANIEKWPRFLAIWRSFKPLSKNCKTTKLTGARAANKIIKNLPLLGKGKREGGTLGGSQKTRVGCHFLWIEGPVWHRARAPSHLRLTAEQQNKKITPQFLIRYIPYFVVRMCIRLCSRCSQVQLSPGAVFISIVTIPVQLVHSNTGVTLRCFIYLFRGQAEESTKH